MLRVANFKSEDAVNEVPMSITKRAWGSWEREGAERMTRSFKTKRPDCSSIGCCILEIRLASVFSSLDRFSLEKITERFVFV